MTDLISREAAISIAQAELKNTAKLLSNPPQSSAAWNIRNALSNLPAAPAVAGLREALAIAESRYRDNGEGFGIIEAIREALFTALRAAPEGGDV